MATSQTAAARGATFSDYYDSVIDNVERVIQGKRDVIELIDKQPISAKELREIRAVEVLAWIGTTEARDLLAELAKGAASARLTEAAAGAIRRLKIVDGRR